MSGDICDITTKERDQVFFVDTPDKLDGIKQTIDSIWDYCMQNKLELVVTTILPVSLQVSAEDQIDKGYLRRSRFTKIELKNQEDRVNGKVRAVNPYIGAKSKELDTVYVNLDKNIQNRVLRRKSDPANNFRFSVDVLKRLVDGVHANDKLKDKIQKNIANVCKLLLVPELPKSA